MSGRRGMRRIGWGLSGGAVAEFGRDSGGGSALGVGGSVLLAALPW